MLTVTDLFPNALTGLSTATAVNASGVVVGIDFGSPGIVWTPQQANGTTGSESSLPTDISPGMRPVASSNPLAINSAGVIVGSCNTVDANGAGVTRAFRFTPGDSFLVDLGTFNVDPATGTSFGSSTATGINDAGQIVGSADDTNGVRRAFVLQPGSTKLTDILGGHQPSEAKAICNGRTIVGEATFFDAAGAERSQAFSADVVAGTFSLLGTLLVNPLDTSQFFGSAKANAVSRNGTIAGSSDTLPPILMSGVIFAHPTVPFGPQPSEALGASSTGFAEKVVGRFWPNPPDQKTSGFVFDASNGMLDLNTQINDSDWHIDSALGINENGQICAVATHANLGGPRGVLLTP